MSSKQKNWYLIKDKNNHCQIVEVENQNFLESKVFWGPFRSQAEAIAHRVGLIRAGKCQPF